MSDSLYGVCRAVQRNDPCTSMVNLNHCHMGNDGCRLLAQSLKGNTKVVVLFLNQNRLQGQSQAWNDLCHALARHPTLTHVYLSHNPDLANHGVTLLAQALSLHTKSCSPLRVLKLTHCGIGNTGARALSWCLRDHHLAQLETLDLQHNAIGPAGMHALAKSLPRSLGTLDVSYNPALEQCACGCGCEANAPCWWNTMADTLQGGGTTTMHKAPPHLALKTLRVTQTQTTTTPPTPCQERVHLWLTLNRWGRAHFGQTDLCPAEWARVLGRAATMSSPSLLYSLIRARADLVVEDFMFSSARGSCCCGHRDNNDDNNDNGAIHKRLKRLVVVATSEPPSQEQSRERK